VPKAPRTACAPFGLHNNQSRRGSGQGRRTRNPGPAPDPATPRLPRQLQTARARALQGKIGKKSRRRGLVGGARLLSNHSHKNSSSNASPNRGLERFDLGTTSYSDSVEHWNRGVTTTSVSDNEVARFKFEILGKHVCANPARGTESRPQSRTPAGVDNRLDSCRSQRASAHRRRSIPFRNGL
jgi:hypothetical protein